MPNLQALESALLRQARRIGEDLHGHEMRSERMIVWAAVAQQKTIDSLHLPTVFVLLLEPILNATIRKTEYLSRRR